MCLCSSQGKLYFYQLSEDVPDQSDSVVEGDLTPVSDLPDALLTGETSRSEEGPEQSHKASSMFKIVANVLVFSIGPDHCEDITLTVLNKVCLEFNKVVAL